jgi:hypothetical protein
MQSYYYFFSLVALSIVFLLIRFFVLRRRNIPVELFVEALRNENSGQFEAAVVTYENALQEVKKIRFHDTNLKKRIIDKLKLLHTIIEYKNNLRITR